MDRKHMDRRLSRRESLRWLAMTGAAAGLAACGGQPAVSGPAGTNPQASDPQGQGSANSGAEKAPPAGPTGDQAYLAAARGEDPAAITEAALKALGGIERFVKQGYDVIIKPNICTDYYTYKYGATTNPTVVATLVKLALGAGAKRVRVMDFPFGGTAESAYAKSGIADAVKAAGGEMEVMNRNKFRKTNIPQGKSIKDWEIYQDMLTCDLLVDVGIAKHHSLARITAASKNLLGAVESRSQIHADMGQRIPDLISVLRPQLTVVDAVRTLMAHGPTGGNLDDIKMNNLVIASHDIVAADAYSATLFKLTGADIPYIKNAAERGLGTLDLQSIKVEEIAV